MVPASRAIARVITVDFGGGVLDFLDLSTTSTTIQNETGAHRFTLKRNQKSSFVLWLASYQHHIRNTNLFVRQAGHHHRHRRPSQTELGSSSSSLEAPAGVVNSLRCQIWCPSFFGGCFWGAYFFTLLFCFFYHLLAGWKSFGLEIGAGHGRVAERRFALNNGFDGGLELWSAQDLKNYLLAVREYNFAAGW